MSITVNAVAVSAAAVVVVVVAVVVAAAAVVVVVVVVAAAVVVVVVAVLCVDIKIWIKTSLISFSWFFFAVSQTVSFVV